MYRNSTYSLPILLLLISISFIIFGENSLPVYAQSATRLPLAQAANPVLEAADPINVNVYVLEFNPLVNGTALNSTRHWQNPNELMDGYISTVRQVTGGTVNFHVVAHETVEQYPTKEQGFVFNSYEQYSACVENPDSADYCKRPLDYHGVLTTRYNGATMSACEMIESRQADEVWLWGGPWFGPWEYYFVNLGQFCNRPTRPFTVMGFSYERDVPEMVHDLGHRTETYVRNHIAPALWNAFDGQIQRYSQPYDDVATPDSVHPEVDATNAHCGNIHFPPQRL